MPPMTSATTPFSVAWKLIAGVDLVVVHADQHAGQATERRGNRKHGLVHRIGIHAHLSCGVAIECRGSHRPAQLGKPQETPQHRGSSDPDAGDQQIERSDRAAAHLKPPMRQRIGQGARIG